MSTRIQQEPFAFFSLLTTLKLVAVGSHRLRINVTLFQQNPELDCYRRLKRIIDLLLVHPGPKLVSSPPIASSSFCAPVPSHFSCTCVTSTTLLSLTVSPHFHFAIHGKSFQFALLQYMKKTKLSVFVYTRVWATMSTTIKQIHCFQYYGPFFWRAPAEEEEEFTHCWCSICLYLRRSRTPLVSLRSLAQKPQKETWDSGRSCGGFS